eukprot:717907-Prorocentrum_minimum.AAC.1
MDERPPIDLHAVHHQCELCRVHPGRHDRAQVDELLRDPLQGRSDGEQHANQQEGVHPYASLTSSYPYGGMSKKGGGR